MAGRLPKDPDPAFSQPQSVGQQGYPEPRANNIFALPPTKGAEFK